jgi:hypothetical protein
MRRPYLLATVGVAAMLVSAPARPASPVLILAVAAGVAGTVVIVAANQPAAVPGPVQGRADAPTSRARAAMPAAPQKREVWTYTDKYGWIRGSREDVSALDAPLAPTPGTSSRIVNACRDALASTAAPYGVTSLEVVSAGKQKRVKGRIVASLDVRAIYSLREGQGL